jgi:hypothetical protein
MSLDRTGVSFISQNQGAINAIQKEFIEKFLVHHPNIRISLDSSNKTVWNSSLAKEFLSSSKLLLEHLYVLIHLLSGLPPRATEIIEALLVNTRSKQRNVFLYGDQMAISLTYNKTDSIKGTQNRITRVLPRHLSRLFFDYLIFIRPLEMYELFFDY